MKSRRMILASWIQITTALWIATCELFYVLQHAYLLGSKAKFRFLTHCSDILIPDPSLTGQNGKADQQRTTSMIRLRQWQRSERLWKKRVGRSDFVRSQVRREFVKRIMWRKTYERGSQARCNYVTLRWSWWITQKEKNMIVCRQWNESKSIP